MMCLRVFDTQVQHRQAPGRVARWLEISISRVFNGKGSRVFVTHLTQVPVRKTCQIETFPNTNFPDALSEAHIVF